MPLRKIAFAIRAIARGERLMPASMPTNRALKPTPMRASVDAAARYRALCSPWQMANRVHATQTARRDEPCLKDDVRAMSI